MIANSTVAYNQYDQVMRCRGCLEVIPVSRAVLTNPERFVSMLEEAQIDHSHCHEYTDAKLARNARRFKNAVNQLLVASERRNVEREAKR